MQYVLPATITGHHCFHKASLLLQYVDLDEFLSENGIPVDGVPQSTVQQQQVIKQSSPLPEAARGLPHPHSLPHPVHTPQQRGGDPPGPPVLELVTTKRERSPTPSEPLSPDTLNPPSPADSSKGSVDLFISWNHHTTLQHSIYVLFVFVRNISSKI